MALNKSPAEGKWQTQANSCDPANIREIYPSQVDDDMLMGLSITPGLDHLCVEHGGCKSTASSETRISTLIWPGMSEPCTNGQFKNLRQGKDRSRWSVSRG